MVQDGNEQGPIALKLLPTALQMEEEGRAFYRKAAEASQDRFAKDLLMKLAEDENVHIARIKKIYGALSEGQGWSADWQALSTGGEDVKAMFAELSAGGEGAKKGAATDLEAIEVALGLEQRAVKFYSDYLGDADQPEEKAFLEKMVREEKGHEAALLDAKDYLADPDSWFRDHERSGLDGA